MFRVAPQQMSAGSAGHSRQRHLKRQLEDVRDNEDAGDGREEDQDRQYFPRRYDENGGAAGKAYSRNPRPERYWKDRPATSVVGAEENTSNVMVDLHSHGNMGAFWSGTDNADEQGFRVYGVIGRLDERPEIRLRLGVYGYWFPIPVSLLFDGSTGFLDVAEYEIRRGGRRAACRGR